MDEFYNKKSLWAETWQRGQQAEMLVENEAMETFPGIVHHIGTDDYDNSLEVYFMPSALADFAPSPEQVQRVLAMGFSRCWLNFTDGSECYFEMLKIWPRKKVDNPRWTQERFENWGKRT